MLKIGVCFMSARYYSFQSYIRMGEASPYMFVKLQIVIHEEHLTPFEVNSIM